MVMEIRNKEIESSAFIPMSIGMVVLRTTRNKEKDLRELFFVTQAFRPDSLIIFVTQVLPHLPA